MKLDKKHAWEMFLFEFKMGHEAVETTHNINKTFSPGSNKHTVQWWFKKFCKEAMSLEDVGVMANHQNLLTNW